MEKFGWNAGGRIDETDNSFFLRTRVKRSFPSKKIKGVSEKTIDNHPLSANV
jgi:hypothetical protein